MFDISITRLDDSNAKSKTSQVLELLMSDIEDKISKNRLYNIIIYNDSKMKQEWTSR